jgi:hypothetical protein
MTLKLAKLPFGMRLEGCFSHYWDLMGRRGTRSCGWEGHPTGR